MYPVFAILFLQKVECIYMYKYFAHMIFIILTRAYFFFQR